MSCLFSISLDCACDLTGSESLQCQANGQCQCKDGYSGQKCNIACPQGWIEKGGKCFQIPNQTADFNGPVLL